MTRPLKLLLVEDDDNDVELVLFRLREDGYAPDYECVNTAKAMGAALVRRQDWDIVISDYSLPNFSAPLALTVLQKTGLDIPFIIISGTIGEERAVATMRAGARDFILKHDLRRLTPIIERELRESRLRLTRRRTEQALKRAEFKYRQIVNTAQEGIWVLDAANCTTFVNKYMALMLGYAEYEMIDRPLSDFLFDPATALQQGFSAQTELKFRHRDGDAVWGLISSTAMNGDNGKHGGFLGMVTDVTDRKRAEEEREQLVQELQETVRARDEFLAVASHELRTPITTLKLHLQTALLMRDRGTEMISDTLAGKLEGMDKQVNRITELIDELLDVTRMINEKMLYEFTEIDLAQAVRDIAARFAEDARRANIALRVDAPSQPVRGTWDKLRIEQIIGNLISNALRHANGMPVEVSLSADAEAATLIVRDKGPGIPPDMQQKIFDRFEQGALSRKVGGLGLGLYIVKQIVDAHGGNVRVESTPGQGSSFIVILPLERADVDQADDKKILIVEDDRDVVEALTDLLQEHGYEVESALNGREALDLLQNGKRPGLILLDLMMPVMDGMQFREAQVADPEIADIPVVVMSAHPKGREIMNSIRAQGYLKKPVEISNILETVERVSPRSSMSGSPFIMPPSASNNERETR